VADTSAAAAVSLLTEKRSVPHIDAEIPADKAIKQEMSRIMRNELSLYTPQPRPLDQVYDIRQ
jgi:hypothetical protein